MPAAVSPLRRLASPLFAAVAAALSVALAGCSPAPEGVEFWDPYEAQNRAVHAENQAIDRMFFSGAASGYGEAVPAPVRRGVANFAQNAGTPSDVVNSVLQGRVEAAGANFFRFVLNTTVGIGGVFDFAGALGIEPRRTDFGETLHVWGAPEGAYLELPVLGPTTERDVAGRIVDIAIDPFSAVRPTSTRLKLRGVRLGARVAARIGDREEYSDFYDALIDESAESYVQTRALFLQYRRFQLGMTTEPEPFDPYEDLYGD